MFLYSRHKIQQHHKERGPYFSGLKKIHIGTLTLICRGRGGGSIGPIEYAINNTDKHNEFTMKCHIW